MKQYFQCLTSGKTWPLSPNIIGCPSHPGPYSDLVVADSSFDPDQLYPATPLYTVNSFGKKYGFKHLLLKDESKNLTGSFKDRGAEELMKYLKKWQIKEINVVSCGNDAISTAAFAQKNGIKCVCLVPSHVNGSKGKLIKLYGGQLMPIDDSYEDIFKNAIRTPFSYNATGGYNSIKEEGLKKIAYELTDIPKIVIVPCGNGTLLWSIYKGFKELQQMNLIKNLPKLIGVQVKGAAPLKAGNKVDNPIDSIADGIVASESFSAIKVGLALTDTQGEIIEVTDDEIIEGLKEAIELESIIPEPTSAAVFAGVKKLSDKDKKQAVVLILTAGGYKNLDEILKIIS